MKDIATELAALRQSIEQQSRLQEETNAIMRSLVKAMNRVAQELAIPEKEARSHLS